MYLFSRNAFSEHKVIYTIVVKVRTSSSTDDASELCFSFAARAAAPPPRLRGLRLDQTPLQQFYAAVHDAGAAGVLNPQLRKALAIDDKHGHRIKALLEQARYFTVTKLLH